MLKRSLLCAVAASGLLAGCANMGSTSEPAAGTAATAQVEERTIGILFEAYDEANLAQSPESQAYRGQRGEDYGKWDDYSDADAVRYQQRLQETAATVAMYDPADLTEQEQLSQRLFASMAARSASLFPFRDNGYLFNQMSGAQSGLPAFLINIHSVDSVEQAAAYISRIDGIADVLDTLTAESRERADNGLMPPKWVYPYVISDIENLLAAGSSNAVLDNFAKKVESVELRTGPNAAEEAATKVELVAQAAVVWEATARPAYQRLLAEMKRQQAIAPTDDGVWRLPNGAAYYKALLASYTTTDLTPDEVHNIGLREVDRIHGEMRTIMAKVGFEGTLQEFFAFTREDPQFFYETREGYLKDTATKMAAMEAKLPEFFATLPTDPLVVKPVEAFREKSAGKAFYQRPAPDGSRPGTYYVNLYNLRDMSKNELEALAYHEGLPGHHLQLSIQTGLGDIPPFRRFGGVTAYSEGWGLYTEELGKDMGFYTDPYSDFGRLGMELWRACRLVVDTGIHDKRWSREEAIAYLSENTPNPEGDVRKAIERYIVYPGQATAYMIGKLKIMELRNRSQAALGDDFDIRGFHDVILKSGPVPLSIMEENVDAWINAEMAG
ncbi:DUF885 domain-containing protein [Altererythrobacter sp. ZODW24]|uniref:DUF885 domain-containing protein n=1 Tax=Altererythrobacter sp. ZODW24 TaxID=2185142 RepID=UPI000DF825CA|nr:DUF885 domain-containing protein [Altererythrobacter sp. ZODW24]